MNELQSFKSEGINLKKTKKIFLEDAQYYVEEVRRNIITNLGENKIYKDGLNINTPINLKFQKIANQSLIKGLVEYDERKGWRGPIKNIKYKKNGMKIFLTQNLRILLAGI